MAFAFEKTWQFTYGGGTPSANHRLIASGTVLTDNRTAMKHIVDALTGFTSGAWQCRFSCDGTTAGVADDLVNRWDSLTDLVWAAAGVAHSWMVLRQTGIGAGFEICIDLSNAGSANATVVVSPANGFTGGSTTNRPTATDEWVLLNNTFWITAAGGSTWSGVLSVIGSTDGQCTRVFLIRPSSGNAIVEGCWILDKPKNPVTGWTVPFVGFILAASGNHVTDYTRLSAQTNLRIEQGGTVGSACLTTEHYSSGTTRVGERLPVRHDLDKEYLALPAGVLVPSTVGVRGHHGVLFDAWLGPGLVASDILASLRVGDTFPDDDSRSLIILRDLILPWNGQEPRIV